MSIAERPRVAPASSLRFSTPIAIGLSLLGCAVTPAPPPGSVDAHGGKADDVSIERDEVTVTVLLEGATAQLVSRIHAGRGGTLDVVDGAPLFRYDPVTACSAGDGPPRCVLTVPTSDFLEHDAGPTRATIFGEAAQTLRAARPWLVAPGASEHITCVDDRCDIHRVVLDLPEGSAAAEIALNVLNRAPPPMLAALVGDWERPLREAATFPFASLTEAAAVLGDETHALAPLLAHARHGAYDRANASGLGCRDVDWTGGEKHAALVAELSADGIVSTEELTERLVPALREEPHHANDLARAALGLLAQDLVEPAEELGALLTTRFGYRTELLDAGLTAEEVRRIAVGEMDHDFECLIEARAAWNRRITVAVLDSGTSYVHPLSRVRALENLADPPNGEDDDGNGLVDDDLGWDFRDGGSPVVDDALGDLHGLHVAAIAGRGTHRIRVLHVRDTSGLDDARAVAAARVSAIHYAAERGARIINLSQVTADDVAAEVIEAMSAHPDVLILVAAGNDGGQTAENRLRNHAIASAGLPNVALVAAADSVTNQKADYSTYHPTLVRLAAPGDWLSARAGPTAYGMGEGTSQATPYVANLAAKMLLLAPSLTPERVLELLDESTTPSDDWTPYVASGGVVDAERALDLAAAEED